MNLYKLQRILVNEDKILILTIIIKDRIKRNFNKKKNIKIKTQKVQFQNQIDFLGLKVLERSQIEKYNHIKYKIY